METSEIIDLVKQVYPYGIAFFIAVIMLRKRNILVHVLWNKLFGSNLTFKNKTLEKVTDDQLDFEKFQLMYPKIKFINLNHIKDLIEWCKKHDTDMNEAHTNHECFKYERKPEGKVICDYPSFFKFDAVYNPIMLVISMLALVTVLLIPALSGNFGEVLLKGKHSNRYIWLNDDGSFTGAFNDDKNIVANKETCGGKNPFNLIDDKEHLALCELVTDEKKLTTYFEEMKRSGIKMFLISFAVLIMVNLFNLKSIRDYNRTKKFMRYLKELSSKE